MAEQVGTKTGQKTKAGRDVYKTSEGESVSEKSVTIKFGDNAYVNAPSIHNGKQYTEDEVKEMLLEGIIKPTSRHDSLEEALEAASKRSSSLMKEGGMAKRMAKQMELFEPVERGFEEGGLMEEGGMVDEESGNEVPPGSLREEVRDDIPAQLSEGEFVFPADVVRYIGLEKLMMMRQEAKQGLAQMEAMGQMGNGDEAVVEDDMPFDMYDLDIEDEEEYNSETRNYQVGGYVAPPVPFQQQPYNRPTQVNPQTGTYTLPGTGIAGYQVPSGGQTGYTPYGGAAPYFQPVQFTGPQFQTSLQTTNLPTFAETVGTSPGQYDELRTYVNDAGQILQIPFKNGQPIYPIPEGYRLQGDQPQAEAPTTIAPTTGVRQEGDRGGDGPVTTTPSTKVSGSSLFDLFSTKDTGFPKSGLTEQASFNAFSNLGTQSGKGYGGSKYGLSNEAYRSGVTQLGADQLGSMSPIFGGLKAIGDKLGFDTTDISFNDRAVVGNLTRQTALETLGMINPAQMYSNPQATYVGQAMQIATDAFNAGKSLNEVTSALAEHAANNSGIIRATANEISRAYLKSKGFSIDGIDSFSELGDMASRQAQVGISDIQNELMANFGSSFGEPLSSAEYGNITNKDIKSQYNSYRSRIAGTDTFVHELTPAAKSQKARLDAQKAQLEAIQTANKAAKEAETDRKTQQEEMRARQKAEAKAAGYTGFGDYSKEGKESMEGFRDDGSSVGGSAAGGGMKDAGDVGFGSGTDCLTEKMKVKLNGVIDFVTNIKVGDLIDGSVVKEVLHKHMRGGYFVINNELEITNDHPVLANGKWTTPEELYIGDYINDVKVESINYVDRLTPTVSIVIDGDSFDVYTEGNTYTVHGRYREVRQQVA